MVLSIVFSKDRALQLQGFLESFQANVSGDVQQVVCFPEWTDSYRKVSLSAASSIMWWAEKQHITFEETLLSIIESSTKDYVYLHPDDAVITNPVDLDRAADLLRQRDDVAYVDTRHGHHMSVYEWITGHTGDVHRDYAWNITGTITRMVDIKDMLQSRCDLLRGPLDVPNDLEVLGGRFFGQGRKVVATEPMGCVITQDVNRVQDKYLNGWSSNYFTADRLEKLFKEGQRLDWEFCQGYEGILTGEAYFKLRAPRLGE